MSQLDAATAIDVYNEPTTWTCSYVRLLDDAHAVWLPAGALIECTCDVDASSDCPTYSIRVRVSHNGQLPTTHLTEFSWRGEG